MKRRSRAGGEPLKGRRRKTPVPKRPDAAKAVAPANSSLSGNEAEVARLTRELSEAREQQAATSEVLKAISRSTFDLLTVLDTLLQSAVRLCRADQGTVAQRKGDTFYRAVSHGFSPVYLDYVKDIPIKPGRDTGTGRALLEGKVIHIPDVLADPDFTWKEGQRLGGFRTVLGVPMLREGVAVGVLALTRSAVRPFSDEQIALVENFAAQAVIAIENARLLNELRQSLEQQTATAEVLKVVSASQGDLSPVFAALLEKAVRICGAKFGNLWLLEGDLYRNTATLGAPAAFVEFLEREQVYRPDPRLGLAKVIQTGETFQIADLSAVPSHTDRMRRATVELAGARTLIAVPMLKDGEVVGVIAIYRQEVRPFTDKQIGLVQNFAAQAVIAVENARLLNELRQRTTDLTERTADLTEALERQTATSEVLQVISSSPGDLQPVFATMLEKAVRLCDATFGNIYRWHGELSNIVASHNTPPGLVEARTRLRIHFVPKDLVGQAIANKKAVHIADLAEHQDYIERSSPGAVAAVELGGVRTHVVVPMLKDDELIGTFHLSRQEVRPFTDKQIELVTNFAAQAIIAIENTRLLKELRERTQEVEKLNQHLEQRVTDQVDEIERMSRLRRFLPPQVADLIVASGSEKQLESHRREITALFCDLRGFTGFTESADAEDVMALLREYHAAIGELVIRYSGTLERYAGDGVMVVFNDPVPVENPALQAVLMALELRNALGALTHTWSRLGHDIGFGIGIAHGFATLGTIGYEGRFDYAAIGTVSNVASRLCDEAKPGQILISARVLTKVENAVKVEPVGEFELKGIRRAYNVIAALA